MLGHGHQTASSLVSGSETRVDRTPPSVLHLLAPADFGGLESVILTLARGQLDAGQRVEVASFIDPGRADHPFTAALRDAAIPSHAVAVAARGYLTERRAVRDLVEKLRPDVVHTHGYRPDVIDAGVARRMGRPTVTTVHGFTRAKGRGRIYEWVQRRSFRRFDAVVVVSAPQRRELIESGVRPERIHLLRNAWRAARPPLSRAEARAALGIGAEAPTVGWVGRLNPEKAPDIMVEVLAAFPSGDLALSIVGAGRMEPELRVLAEERGVAHRIHWHGAVPEAGRYLPAFDALCLTSWTEGTPIVLLEAMAAGVPIVTTAVGGVPDVVSEHEALLAPAGDVQALAGALDQVLVDREAAGLRCESAQRRLAREFAVEPWVRSYSDVYTSCL